MKENNFSILIVTADESTGRLFMEKIKNFFNRMTLDMGLFGEARPALLFIERHLPSVIIVSEQIPGMKWQDFIKSVEKYSPHSLILRLNTKLEGLQMIDGSHVVDVGIPVLEWEKVLMLIEEEIPTEVKFRFGMARRENVLLKKLKNHSHGYGATMNKNGSTFTLIPREFDSLEKSRGIISEDKFEGLSSVTENAPQSDFSYPPTRKEEWIILLTSLSLAVIFHLPWSEKGNWELLRWFFNFMAAVSLMGFILKPFGPKSKDS